MEVRIQKTGRCFELLRDYKIKTSLGLITIPAGFQTDLASIPKIFWSLVSPLEAHFPAAVLHDYFYRVPNARQKINNGIGFVDITREVADEIFLEEMGDLKIPGWKRFVMYYAVRLGGNSSWVEG